MLGEWVEGWMGGGVEGARVGGKKRAEGFTPLSLKTNRTHLIHRGGALCKLVDQALGLNKVDRILDDGRELADEGFHLCHGLK